MSKSSFYIGFEIFIDDMCILVRSYEVAIHFKNFWIAIPMAGSLHYLEIPQ